MAAAALPISALIIDDEPLARQELQFLLEAAGGIEIVGQGSNGIEAVDLIRTHKPDVVFLDVRMPGLDGFAVLKKVLALDRRFRLPQVVFATAFDQYAVRAFEVNAVDYLLKPFDQKRLVKTLEKLRSRLNPGAAAGSSVTGTVVNRGDQEAARPSGAGTAAGALEVSSGPLRNAGNQSFWPDASQSGDAGREADAAGAGSIGIGAARPGGPAARLQSIAESAEAKLDALLRMIQEQTSFGSQAAAGTGLQAAAAPRSGKVVVRTGSRLLLVDGKDVCFASIDEGRITVATRTLEGDSNCRTLEELMEQLDPAQFWRAHRSHLVNIQHIREVVPWFRSTYQLRMDDRKNTEIPVSRSQTKRLRELFKL